MKKINSVLMKNQQTTLSETTYCCGGWTSCLTGITQGVSGVIPYTKVN